MEHSIAALDALEILDSRGNPTLQIGVTLSNGLHATASVPSGASTSQYEAHELRDGDARRYAGSGVRRAIDNVVQIIRPALIGRDPTAQAEIDRLLIDLDGTPNKSKLGANAILGASMGVARVAAKAHGLPLYRYLGGAEANHLPVPLMNVINGGKHAANKLEFQEFMIVPHGAPTFSEAVRWAAETFHTLKAILIREGYSASVGDEGGFAPELKDNEEACQIIVLAISEAGYAPGRDISIALDPAATSFFEDGHYEIPSWGQGPKTDDDLQGLYEKWVNRYPIVLIEDGFAETAWSAFQKQTANIGKRVTIVGDDIYSTNPQIIRRAVAEQTTNAALIKLNQIGTVTETIEAIELCRAAGWRYVISHRSGETTDSFIADFAVAMDGGLLKAGSLSRGERVVKYNRLMEIEHELGAAARFVDVFAGRSEVASRA
jgi:enolase